MWIFSKDWFRKYQKVLLWFANTGIGRRVLCINGDKSSVGKNEIVKIEPHAITWIKEVKISHSKNYKKIQIQPVYSTEFRTHNKFAKRIFYAFYPIWWLMHQWDISFANNFRPAWNLGFDTLTVNPDGHEEVSSVDGQVGNIGQDAAWATVIAGAGGYSVDNTAHLYPFIARASNTNNQYAQCMAGIILFNTSTLTGGANISAGVFSLHGDTRYNNLNGEASANSALVLVASNPNSNTALTGTDFGTRGSTSFGVSVKQDSWNDAGYNDITLNANGLAAISKTGISKFATRGGWDFNATTTGLTWTADGPQGFEVIAADTAGTSTDPKLVVTYTLPAGGSVMII